jgi:DNA-binding response OmpR family regulator
MSNLRRKLGTRLIRTVRGVGYVIDDVEQHERA